MPIIQRVALKPEKGSNSPTITQQVIGRTVGSNTRAPNPCTQPFPFAIPFPLPRMPLLPSIDEKLLLGSIVINWMILWSRQKGRQCTEALGHSGSEAGTSASPGLLHGSKQSRRLPLKEWIFSPDSCSCPWLPPAKEGEGNRSRR